MTIHQNTSELTGMSERMVTLFPQANKQIVMSLGDQVDTLVLYLAQVHEVTVGEVREIISVFDLRSQKISRAVA